MANSWADCICVFIVMDPEEVRWMVVGTGSVMLGN